MDEGPQNIHQMLCQFVVRKLLQPAKINPSVLIQSALALEEGNSWKPAPLLWEPANQDRAGL